MRLRKRIILITLAILVLSIVFSGYGFASDINVIPNEYIIDDSSSEFSLAQFIPNIVSLLSLIFIAYQVHIAVKDYKITNERLRKEKAIELAKYYESEILPLTTIVGSVFNHIGINDLTSNINERDMKDFDMDELLSTTSESIRSEYEKILKSEECKKAYKYMCYLNGASEKDSIEVSVKIEEKDKCNLGDKDLQRVIKSSLDHIYDIRDDFSFNSVITNTLNKLEFFAMNFNYNIADEKVVYQSLHQTYRGVVKLLYIRISTANKDSKDKYFTNIIDLFSLWNTRYLKYLENERAAKKRSIHKGEKLKI